MWIGTNYGGLDKFDPTTERFIHYRHDPNNPNSISGDSVESIARDSRGYLWIGTNGNGLDKFDPATATFTHYRNDSDGRFIGRITKVIAGRRGNVWFTGERGLFHLDTETGRITHPAAANAGNLAADYVYEDDAGDLWMLAWSPAVGLIKYERNGDRLTTYAMGAGCRTHQFEDGTGRSDSKRSPFRGAPTSNLTDGCIEDYRPGIDYFPDKVTTGYARILGSSEEFVG
jgi:streptogramin lyase